MKRIISLSVFMFCVSVVFSQLRVSSDGRLSVGMSDPYAKTAIEGNIYTLKVARSGYFPHSLGCWGSAISASNEASSSRGDIGIQAKVGLASPSDQGRAIGITGSAYNATSGYNYGVIGNLEGSNNGTGILGIAQDLGELGVYIDGRYAGYFQGNVRVTGTINGVVVGNSDIRYKRNIVDLEKESALTKVLSLNPISYNYNQVSLEPESDTSTVRKGLFDEKSIMYQKKHFGLVAQDLQKIYPDLVYEDNNGYLSINYIELIPLLVQSIKELKQEVDMLGTALPVLRAATSDESIAIDIQQAVLYQNAPNPFSEQTEIKFSLPDYTNNASIYIFNMQGTLLKQIPVSSGQPVVIYGSELNAGMYLYSLIINGKEIDTKRMILTK